MTIPASEMEGHAVPPLGESEEGVAGKVAGRSPTQLAMARFRADKLSMISFYVSCFVVFAAVASPILVKIGVFDPDGLNQDKLNTDLGGIPHGAFGGVSWSHPLGLTPGNGEDLLSRLSFSMTYSLGIALTGTLITVLIGVVLGIISGFSGGFVDATVGRFIDLTLSFPQTMMLLALAAPTVLLIRKDVSELPLLGFLENPDLANGLFVVIILSAFGWPPVARVVRGQVLSIREREFIEAAKLIGASRKRLYFKEVLPNVWAPILVYTTLLIPAYISAEAAFSFLGVGIKPPTPTLGNILRDSVSWTTADPTYFFLPGIVLALTVVAFNLVGDGARDALDPKTHR
ncbi:ABC transporter permease [Nocardioides marmoriginsengisoli]|uniref:ABC transporter permease n=1 Tax=Nocardioides marmoriginsengisoli TaxID=661483 RepID=A0A3N0CMX3_9ACTN|nr:ABC transporter permease [Nocardioides marmoriginsengisoli]RNL64416.1 ABC transporter permease [Nocardioides marmoriginsengisoli]